MSNLERVEQLIGDIKKCGEKEANTYFVPLLEVFPLIAGNEKERVAAEFLDWAKHNVAQHPRKLAHGYYLQGLADFFAEKYEQALQTLNESQQLFEAQGDTDEAMLCVGTSGAIYRTLGNVGLALKALWESYGELKKKGIFQHNIMACTFQIASIYVEQKNYDEAIPLFKETLDTAKQLGNLVFVSNALQGLGNLYRIRKEYNEAKGALEQALENAERTQSPMFISNALTELGNYYFETGDYEKSAELNRHALALREQHKMVGGSITNLMQIADIYSKQGNADGAIGELEKGLALAERINVKPKLFQLHKMLSKIYGDKQEFEKSLRHYAQFHEIREQVEAEYAAKKVKNLQLVFEAEQTKKENAIIKRQKAEIERKNIELQETIGELTRTKVGKKAKAITLIIAIVLFTLEEVIIHSVLHLLPGDNFYLSFVVKMVIIFSLKPIDSAIEHALLKRIIKKEARQVVV
jgi:tetratricopeptide (TPR) repeat protein